MKRALICLAMLALLLVPALASATVIGTMNDGGNNNAGNMFDLINISAAPITLDGNFTSGLAEGAFSNTATSGTMEVYYRVGTYVGHTSSLADWTLLGTASVSGPGTTTPISFNIGNSLTVTAGETVGLFLYLSNSDATTGGILCTNLGTGSPAALSSYSDGTVTLSLGSSIGDTGLTPLVGAGVFGNRIWNGSVEYSAVPLPPSVLLLGTGLVGLVALRRRQS